MTQIGVAESSPHQRREETTRRDPADRQPLARTKRRTVTQRLCTRPLAWFVRSLSHFEARTECLLRRPREQQSSRSFFLPSYFLSGALSLVSRSSSLGHSLSLSLCLPPAWSSPSKSQRMSRLTYRWAREKEGGRAYRSSKLDFMSMNWVRSFQLQYSTLYCSFSLLVLGSLPDVRREYSMEILLFWLDLMVHLLHRVASAGLAIIAGTRFLCFLCSRTRDSPS